MSNYQTHFIHLAKQSLNSRANRVKCHKGWFCKRMTCSRCVCRRRNFFILRGLIHSKQKGLVRIVTVSWKRNALADPWIRLIALNSTLAKSLSGRAAGPFIKAMSLGKFRKTPHTHFIVSEATAKIIDQLAHRIWPSKVVVQIKKIRSIESTLGYLFDQNFLVSYLWPNRTKGIRLLSASRPMTVGFPTIKHFRDLNALMRSMQFEAGIEVEL